MSDEGDIDLAELIRLALDSRQRILHTHMPARVLAYDAAKQTADIELVLDGWVPKRSGGVAYEQRPKVSGVPVGHPRGGGFVVHFPLAPGDHVWAMFSEASLDEFIRNNARSQPRDLRMHDLSFAYVIPAGSPAVAKQVAGLSGTSLVIGQESGTQIHITPAGAVLIGGAAATQAMLQGTAHIAALTTLIAALKVFVGTIVDPTGAPSAAKTTMTAAITAFEAHLSTSALSTKHKLDV